MPIRIPVNENYPHFLLRAARRPRTALRAWRVPGPLPTYYWIEITSRCNLRCRSCMKSARKGDAGRDMPLELLDRIIEEAGPSVRCFNLTGFGEFLHHRQVDAVWERMMRRPETDLWFTTNASLMTEEWVRRLAGRRCNVIFSVDGLDAETHRFNRPGANFERLTGALELAAALEREAGGPEAFPFNRHVNFLVMSNNMHQLPGAVDLANRVGATSLRLTYMNYWDVDETFWREQNPLRRREDLARLQAEAIERAAGTPLIVIAPPLPAPSAAGAPRAAPVQRGLMRFFRPSQATRDGFPRFEDRFCPTPFDSLYISVDGKAAPCCAAWYVEVGDLSRQSLRDVWRGTAMRRLRVGMAVGSHTAYCRVCDLPFGLAGGNPRAEVDR